MRRERHIKEKDEANTTKEHGGKGGSFINIRTILRDMKIKEEQLISMIAMLVKYNHGKRADGQQNIV